MEETMLIHSLKIAAATVKKIGENVV